MNPNNNNFRLQVLNSSSPSLRVAAAPTPQPTLMVGGNNPNNTISISVPSSNPAPQTNITIPGGGTVSNDNGGYAGAQDNGYTPPAQQTGFWGHVLNTGKDIVKPFVYTGEDVSNAIGNAEVGIGHALGFHAGQTETNQQQFGDINQGIGIPTQNNTVKNFAGDVLQIAPVVAAPFTGGGSLAAEAGIDAGLGATAGIGNSLTQDNQSVGDYLKNAAIGGALGGAGRFLFAGAGNLLNKITGGSTADALSNAVANEVNPETIQQALNTTPEVAHFLAQEQDPNIIKTVLDQVGTDTSKSALSTLKDAQAAQAAKDQAASQTSPIGFEDPMNPLQSQLPTGWHPDSAPDPVPVLENVARQSSNPTDFANYINGLTGEDKAAATSALDGMTPEEFYAKAGGGTSVPKPAAAETASAAQGTGQLPPEDVAAIQAAGGQIPDTTIHLPSKGIYAKLSPEQAAMLADEVNNVKSGAGDIVHLSALTPQLAKNAKEVALEDLTKESPNAAATIAKMENTLPPEYEAAIKQAGGQVPTANEMAAATSGQTGIRAGTERINNALGTDLPESTYEKSSQAALKANSEAAANSDLEGFTKKVQVALAKPAGSLTDQDLSDAYTAAQKQLEAGNKDVANQILADTLPHDTATAQSLAARNLLAKSTPTGMRKMVINALDKAGVPFDGQLQSDVESILNQIENTPENSVERETLSRHLGDVVTQAIPRSKATAVKEFWRAMLISGPRTAAKVLISQPFSAAQAYLSQFPAAAFDATRAALTGGERTTAVAPFRYFLQGGAQGLQDAAYKLGTNVDVPGSGGFTRDLESTLENGHHQTPLERGIFKLHSSIQKPVMGAMRDNTLASLGKAEGLNQGLSGSELQQYIDNYVKTPPADAYEHAIKVGEQATNQQKTALGSAAGAIQDSAHGAGMIIAPITRVPGAVGTNALYEYSGIKFVKTALYDGLIKQGAAPDFARTLSEDFGKAVVGAGGIQGLGAILGATGNLTPPKAEDPKQAALFKAEGKPTGSVHIPGTNFWMSLDALGPVGIELATGGGFGRGVHGSTLTKGAGGIPGALAEGLASGGQELAQQPYVQGITGVGNALQDPVRYARSFASNLISSAVPAFVSQAATGTDNLQRDVNYNSPTDVIKSKIPFARQSIPASYDQFGQTNPGANPDSSVMGGILGTFDALKTQEGKGGNDPVVQEVSRLAGSLPSADAPGAATVSRSQTVDVPDANGKPVSTPINLNDQQLSDYTRVAGQLAHTGIGNLINTTAYQNMTDQEKAKAINKVITDAHDAAKIQTLNSNPANVSDAVKTALNDTANFGTSFGPKNYATSTLAKTYFNNWNTMDSKQQAAWLKAPADQNSVAITNQINQQRANGLQPFTPSNQLAQLYSKYESDINEHNGSDPTKPTYTPLDLRQKAEAFQKAAATMQLSPMAQDIYQSGGSQDVKTLASKGQISKADLDAAINLDNQLYESGLTSSLKFSKTFRTEYGYGVPSLYGSNGSQPYSTSSGSGSGSGSSSGQYNQRLTTLLQSIPSNHPMPSITGINSTAGTKLPRFSAAARPNPVSPIKFTAPNVTPSKGSVRVTGTGGFNTTRTATLRNSLG